MSEEHSERVLAEVLAEVFAERRRQVTFQAFDDAHDDAHDYGQLLLAAICYQTRAQVVTMMRAKGMPESEINRASAKAGVPKTWPWEDSWWKPKGRRQNLIRGAALLIAEIERMDRAGQS